MHPNLMSSFISGWQCLSPEIQSPWLQPCEEYHLWGWFHPIHNPDTWWSWTQWLYSFQKKALENMRPGAAKIDYYFPKHRVQKQLLKLVVANMPNEGEFLEMPETPSQDNPNSELSQIQNEIKKLLAQIVIDQFVIEVGTKAEIWFKEKVKKEGVSFLKPLLKKKTILEIRERIHTMEDEDDWSHCEYEHSEIDPCEHLGIHRDDSDSD